MQSILKRVKKICMIKIFYYKKKPCVLVTLTFLLTIHVVNFAQYMFTYESSGYVRPGLLNYTCEAFHRDAKNFKVNIDGVEYPTVIPLYYNKSINFECLNSSSQMRTILMWNNFIGLPIVDYGFGKSEVFERLNCPVTNCELTNDRSRLHESDLVLFHLRSHIDRFPIHHAPDQRWVHVIFESPVHCTQCTKYENTFNLSATYTRDSDFTSVYYADSGLFWDTPDPNYNQIDVHANKSELAVAIISDCNSHNNRIKFIESVRQYIPVNIYGKCGQPCPSDQNCRKYVARTHKFFFAFENSFCRDYVTEKFFSTLKYDIIPVVYGSGNYADYVPKSGYIDVLDFKTVKELADHLVYLDRNKTAFNEYFKWKKYLKYKSHPTGGYLCEACIKLHLETYTGHFHSKRFNSMHKYFGLSTNCRDIILNEDNYELVNSKDGIYAQWLHSL